VFERYYADREPRKFFACALHRDRKGCPFFHWVDESVSSEKRERWLQDYRDSNPPLDRSALAASLEAVRSLPEARRVFCHTCSQLVPSSSVSPDHSSHRLQYGVEDSLLTQPTKLLTPHDNKKSNAQYFFSESSCQLLVSEMKRLKVTKVLCVGTPRLHEVIQCDLSPSITSLLLDVDSRYAVFYPPSLYQRYNMFNGYFYEEKEEEVDGRREEGGEGVCCRFLDSGVVALVIDPPFGGLAEVLARQIQCLWAMAGKELSTVLVFPYFMETHVASALPSLTMCDYQVTYENHKHFSSSSHSKKPSPVRLFTNFPAPGPRLPHSQGYRLCRLCQRYVAPNNAHCALCDNCTSKDGRRYRHCGECGVCVKPGREHCKKCGTCQLPDHLCGDRVAMGCHICGSLEHKRRECPEKIQAEEASSTLPPNLALGKRTKRKKGNLSGAQRSKKIRIS
jgi:hypothetical protein